MADTKKDFLSGHRVGSRNQPARTVATTNTPPNIVLPPLPTAPVTTSPPQPTPTVANNSIQSKDTKKKTARATSPKEKTKGKKGSSSKDDKEVPDELFDGVVTHIRAPIVTLLARDCARAFPDFKPLIPDVYFTEDTNEYTTFYAYCRKHLCIAEFLCVTEVDNLQKYRGNYKKFMKGFHTIWLRRVASANGGNGFDSSEKIAPEDAPVNLSSDDAKAVDRLIQKYWDFATSNPKKLSDVV